MHAFFEISKVLVIAPLRVAEDTWSRECEKWDHLKDLTVSKVLGNARQRRKALAAEADIYVINRENVVWLVEELESMGAGWDFDMVVIDELSSFKSSKAKRFRALRKYISGCQRVVGLTGTPAPNGLMDLWSQIYLLDGGERLGKTITGYRERYFVPDKRNAFTVFSYKPKKQAERVIKELISDICLSMSADDWLEMPERIENIRSVKLSNKEQADYERFEKNSYFEFLDGEIGAVSAAALACKLLQYSNGAVYTDTHTYVDVHDRKLDELEEIISISNGKPILCFYNFRHDYERIVEKFPEAVKLKGTDTIAAWNAGEIPLLVTHPASAGHGLNLQGGGNIIVWFGLTWSLELYEQANARLYRQGQESESVIIHHIVTENTIDERVLQSLGRKADVQEDLLCGLRVKYRAGETS
jgi:SNF2 family DNA or RNA helicase